MCRILYGALFTFELFNNIINSTYNDTFINSNPQFEKPISTPLKTPVGATETLYSRHFSNVLCLPCLYCKIFRIMQARTYLITICTKTALSGK